MPIEVDMMLADAANVYDGRLSLLGAGWQVRPPEAAGPSALGVVLRVPRDQAGAHQLRIELVDIDGEPIMLEEDGNAQALAAEVTVTVEGLQDPGLRTPLVATYAFNLAPFPLTPGREYLWRVLVDGLARDEWTVPFRTTPPG
jgi:hypothetical protein